jgi:hypothetical protein
MAFGKVKRSTPLVLGNLQKKCATYTAHIHKQTYLPYYPPTKPSLQRATPNAPFPFSQDLEPNCLTRIREWWMERLGRKLT